MDKFQIRFVPLGGTVDVTMNMYLYEMYKNDHLTDILIVDCGIGFPKEQDLGVDLAIPDITYLTEELLDPVSGQRYSRSSKIRAVLLTHGHEDHISGLGYHYTALKQPPIFTGKLTASFISSKFKEYKIKPNVTVVDYDQVYSFASFKVHFIHITHSIPYSTHLFIETPIGNFYHGSDFKFDLTPPFG